VNIGVPHVYINLVYNAMQIGKQERLKYLLKDETTHVIVSQLRHLNKKRLDPNKKNAINVLIITIEINSTLE
jgi:hypothetical protein